MKTSYVKDGIVTCGECGATSDHDFDHPEMECGTCHTITRVVPECESGEEESWVTEGGVKLAVAEMSDVHARNTLRMLIRQIRLDKVRCLAYHRQILNGEEVVSSHERDARAISDLVNNFNFKPGAVSKILVNDHRTIQQNIARFCVAYLEEMAGKDINRDTDMRNEASVRVAKEFVEKVKERHLPFI